MPQYRSIRCSTIALAGVFALWGLFVASAQQPAAPQALGVLVLKNGNVLQGTVQRQGNYYRIESEGSTLQIPVSQIEMACASLVDAYEQRRQQRVGNATDAHLELARWCLRHGLLAEAAREILDARTDDPGHPALRTLDLQLQQGLADEASRLQREQNAVVKASHEEPAEPAELSPEPQIEPTADVQEKFVRSIQPMLVHSCTTSGCHAPGSKQLMELDRWALEGSGIPTLIRKNLDQVLAQVDAEDPASSPLMRRARQAHGLRNERLSQPLAPYQTAILMEWLNEAAGVKPEPPAKNDSYGADEEELADPAAAGDGELTDAMIDEAAQQMLSGRKKPRTAFTPRDPFDPEIFNRRASRTQPKQAKASAEGEQELSESDMVPESIEFTPTAQASAEESADPPAEAPSRE